MKATCRSCAESKTLSQEAITSPDFDFTCPKCQRIMVLEHDAPGTIDPEDIETAIENYRELYEFLIEDRAAP